MQPLIMIVGVLLAFFALIGVAWLAAAKLGLLAKDQDTAPPTEPADNPYEARDRVLSEGELAFFRSLTDAVGRLPEPRPRILPSVRLAEVVQVKPMRDRSVWQRSFNRIAAKQADFVLCDPETTRPLAIIELDDRSHRRDDRAARDEQVDAVARAAGLPILHVKAELRYRVETLTREVAQLLASSMHTPRPRA